MASPDNGNRPTIRVTHLTPLSADQWAALHSQNGHNTVIRKDEFGPYEPFAPVKKVLDFDVAMDALAVEYGQHATLEMIRRDFPRASEIVRQAIRQFHLH